MLVLWPFRVECPVDVREQVWTELRLAWLANRLGTQRIVVGREAVDSAGPLLSRYSECKGDPHRLLAVLCEAMGFDANRLTIVEPKSAPQLHGQFEIADGAYRLYVVESTSAHPERLAAMLAHAIARAILADNGLLAPIRPDHPSLAHLLVNALGAGVFAANLAVVEWRLGALGGVGQIIFFTRWGNVPARIYGYALALQCRAGGVDDATDAALFGSDAARSFVQGMKYLRKTNDTLVRTDNWGSRIWDRALSEWISDLASPSDEKRLAALWAVGNVGPDATEAIPQLIEQLSHGNWLIRSEAALALGELGPAGAIAVPTLLNAIRREHSSEAQAHRVIALGRIIDVDGTAATELEDVRCQLLELLEETRSQYVRDAVVETLSRIGSATGSLHALLVKWTQQAIAACDDVRLYRCLGWLSRIDERPDVFLEEQFGKRDPELLARALAALKRVEESAQCRQWYEETRGSVLNLRRWLD